MVTRPGRLICTRTKEKWNGSQQWITSMSRRKERFMTLPSALSFPSSKWYLTSAFTRDSEDTWHEEKAVSSPNLTRVFCHLFCFTSKEISDRLRMVDLSFNFFSKCHRIKVWGRVSHGPCYCKMITAKRLAIILAGSSAGFSVSVCCSQASWVSSAPLFCCVKYLLEWVKVACLQLVVKVLW